MEVIEDDTKHHFTICECHSEEHVLHWRYDPGDSSDRWPDEVYLSYYLSNYPYFWKRLWVAVKYVFGYKSKYGHFDCTIIGKPEARKLVDFFQNTYLKKPPMSINDMAGNSQID